MLTLPATEQEWSELAASIDGWSTVLYTPVRASPRGWFDMAARYGFVEVEHPNVRMAMQNRAEWSGWMLGLDVRHAPGIGPEYGQRKYRVRYAHRTTGRQMTTGWLRHASHALIMAAHLRGSWGAGAAPVADGDPHVWASTGRGECLACGAAAGSEGPCAGRRAARVGRAPLVANEDAGRPGGWG